MPSKKLPFALTVPDCVGDYSKIPDKAMSEPLVFNFKAKRIALAAYVGLQKADTQLEVVRQAAMALVMSQLLVADEALSAGRARNTVRHESAKSAGTGSPLAEMLASISGEVLESSEDVEAAEDEAATS